MPNCGLVAKSWKGMMEVVGRDRKETKGIEVSLTRRAEDFADGEIHRDMIQFSKVWNLSEPWKQFAGKIKRFYNISPNTSHGIPNGQYVTVSIHFCTIFPCLS